MTGKQMDPETAALLRLMHPQFRLGHAAAREEAAAEIARLRAAVLAEAEWLKGKLALLGNTMTPVADQVRVEMKLRLTLLEATLV